MSPVQLTTHERARFVRLVDRWLEFGGAWYTDEYLVPIIEEILALRSTGEGGSVSPVQLTTHERARFVRLVDRWLEFGGAWYVDEYLVPIVEEILALRFTDERVGGESTPGRLSPFPDEFAEPPKSGP